MHAGSITQHIAVVVLQEQGLPEPAGVTYQDKGDCAAKFIRAFGFDPGATLRFDGTPGARGLRDAVAKCGRCC